MKRIAMGAVTALSVWFGSALAAEAQQIQPTGPMAINTGTSSCNYTATITYPTQANFLVKLWVYRGTTCWNFSQTMVPNPHTNSYNFSKLVDMTGWGLVAGETLTFKSSLTILTQTYNAADLNVVVSGTRPSSKGSSVQKSNPMTILAVDKDRRKE